MSQFEEDPKEVAKQERRSPQVEKLLRQFSIDGPKGNSKNYKEGWDRAFGNKCLDCDGFGSVPAANGGTQPCNTCDGTGKKVDKP